mgnify:CR=1 FL=1
MSTLEIIAASIGIIYVLLEYKASVWLWVAGVLMDICYCYLYFKSHFYANGALYVYYMIVSLWGIMLWLRNRKKAQEEQSDADQVRSMPAKGWLPVVGASIALTIVLAMVLQRLGESEMVWMDGATAALSCVGMVLMAKKYYQQWLFWIITDPVYVVFMLMSHMYFLAAMYAFYTVISIMGYYRWKGLNKKQS